MDEDLLRSLEEIYYDHWMEIYYDHWMEIYYDHWMEIYYGHWMEIYYGKDHLYSIQFNKDNNRQFNYSGNL